MQFCKTEDQIVDIFTTTLSRDQFVKKIDAWDAEDGENSWFLRQINFLFGHDWKRRYPIISPILIVTKSTHVLIYRYSCVVI